MENLTLEECRTYLKRLKEISICQVCHGPLRSPNITVCTSGHAVCLNCRERIPTCPVCRSSYCQNKPVTLCQIIEAMPRFCRYNYSCNRILRDNDDHESWCEFRLVSCFFCKPCSSVECQALIKHVADVHKYKPHCMWNADFQRENFVCDTRLQINVGVIKLLDGHIFNIHYIYVPKDKSLHVLVLFLPTRSTDKTTFKFDLELYSIDNKASFTFYQEITVTANLKSLIFNIGDPILKSFNEKNVVFKTMISLLEVTESRAATCPITANPSSLEQSFFPSPAKRMRGCKAMKPGRI